jgi:F-type H+-transporting ATPase subunit b
MEMLHEPKFWVTVSFLLLLALLVYKKVPAMVCRMLDDRAAKIKAELEQAQKLREEAELVLAQYKQKQAEYLQEANAMLQKARADADAIVAHAQNELKDSLDARMKQAVDKIAQEEAKAIDDVRNHVVDIALAAARAIIVDQVGNLSQEELVKLALTDMERKVH